ncbi:hypothetical protein [Aromatoleum diolicum]|uniref:Lipoprotein n=1 Tax=Aromatoleum diolicum TaxID=75796 RepID=A0ABX1QGA5_9RHOO|nr:hypothetical protein [Aromatoleum diolicum]NMG77482.1 hypothetical protein [Aromatoleum diolicum]
MKHPARILGLAALALVLSACSKLTPKNYDKLKVGMKYEEVKQVLGAPTKCSDLLAVKSCTWGDDTRFVQVSFIADQVILFNSSNLR